MERDTYITKVIFRKFREGDVIALFPENAGTMEIWTCDSYQHIGQHGAADIGYVILITNPCNPDEYADLYAELESIGYNLKVYKRYTQAMRDVRYKEWDSFHRQYMETLCDSTEVK